MYNVNTASDHTPKRHCKERRVKQQLVPSRSDAWAITTQPSRNTNNTKVFRVNAAWIGENRDIVIVSLEPPSFFKDSNMTTVIREKVGRCDFDNMTAHGVNLRYMRYPHRSNSMETERSLGPDFTGGKASCER